VETGKARWKQIPFELGMFDNDDAAMRTAECAGQQGAQQFNRIRDLLFNGQDEWKNAENAAQTVRAYAREARLDLDRFDDCFRSAHAQERVRAANQLAEALEVNSTPTFFVNGRRIDGALPLQEFRRLLEQAIQESEIR
jgi:protein-disulfide isomerase